MYFSPAGLGSLIIKPLRYYFKDYVDDALKWNEDEKETQIEIGSINNFNKVPVQVKPRIMVDRGQYQVGQVGLTDNLANATFDQVLKGTMKKDNMYLIRGQMQIIIEARQEGTCEKVLDHVQHFLGWTIPYLCDSQGFKTFGVPMGVSSTVVNKEDTELFQCAISLPYVREENWNVRNDGVELKNFLLSVKQMI